MADAKTVEIGLLEKRRASLQATMDRNKAAFDAADRIPTISQEAKALAGIDARLAELNKSPSAPATPEPAH